METDDLLSSGHHGLQVRLLLRSSFIFSSAAVNQPSSLERWKYFENELLKSVNSTRKCNSQLGFLTEEDLVGRSIAEALARSVVEFFHGLRNLGFRDGIQTAALGEVLAQ